MKKISKEDLKNPDSFIQFSDRFGGFVHKHMKLIGGLLLLCIVVGVSVIGFSQFKSESNMEAFEAFLVVKKAQEKRAEELLPEAPTKAEDAAAKDKKNKKPTLVVKGQKATEEEALPLKPVIKPENLQKDYGPIIDKYRSLISSHEGSVASYYAVMNLADLYILYSKAAEVRELVKSVADKAKSSVLFYGLLQTRLGSIYSQLGDCEMAISIFSKLVDNQKLTYLHSDSLLRMGICYEKLNKLALSKETFQRITQDHGKTRAASSAKIYLRLLRLNTPQPAKSENDKTNKEG